MAIMTITNNINEMVRLLMEAFNHDDNYKNITKVSPRSNIINPTITTTINTTTKIE